MFQFSTNDETTSSTAWIKAIQRRQDRSRRWQAKISKKSLSKEANVKGQNYRKNDKETLCIQSSQITGKFMATTTAKKLDLHEVVVRKLD